MQASKQSTYKEFYAAFGSDETKPSRSDSFLADASKKTSQPKDIKQMRKEIDFHLASETQKNKKGRFSETGGTSKKAAESTHQIPFLSTDMKGKKRHRKDKPTEVSKKKLKIWWCA